MIIKSFKSIVKDFINLSVPEKHKKEFNIYIDSTNVNMAKIISIVFFIMEIILALFFAIIKKQEFFKGWNVYYAAMYFLFIIVMLAFYIIFNNLGKDVSGHRTSIEVSGIFFLGFILLWCGGISLLDQHSSGQIIVYIVAAISVAALPFYKPVVLFLTYLFTHSLFLFLMPYFQKSNKLFLGNMVNSTLFIIIAWVISSTRYKNRIRDFNNQKIIHEKNDELKRLNSKLEEANQKLERLSQIDGLTGIFNRFAFDKKIESEWNRCKRHFVPLSMIMVDIDFFKEFNDNYGHQAGDECLRQVAGVLSTYAKRSSDVVARYGGEEFAIILPYTEKENALELAEKIRRGVEGLAVKHECSSISDHVTISLGICTVIPSDQSSYEKFIKTADNALYEAKQRNRNNVVVA